MENLNILTIVLAFIVLVITYFLYRGFKYVQETTKLATPEEVERFVKKPIKINPDWKEYYKGMTPMEIAKEDDQERKAKKRK